MSNQFKQACAPESKFLFVDAQVNMVLCFCLEINFLGDDLGWEALYVTIQCFHFFHVWIGRLQDAGSVKVNIFPHINGGNTRF